MSLKEMPKSWIFSEVGQLCALINGRAFKKSEWAESGLPIIRIQNLNDSKKPFNYFAGDLDEKHLVRNGDLLFAWSGTPGTSFGAHVWLGSESALNQHIFKIVFDEKLINKKFIRHAINQKLEELILNAKGGVGLRHITKGVFEKTLLVFPPLAEQREIVVRLDEQLAQVESLQKRLDAIPELLRRFRQSTLTAAVSGKLTENWRKGNHTDLITSLSEKCFDERKVMIGKRAKKPKRLETIPEVALPPTWSWASIDETCIKITDGTHHSPKSYPSGDYMYVTSKNVREGYITLSNITYVDKVTHDEIYSRCDVVAGDVLYVKDGAKTGLACVNNIKEEISLLSSVGVLRPVSLINSKYLEFYLNSPIGRELMLGMMGGTAIKRLTLTKIMNSPISLPSVDEQIEIVRRVEELLVFSGQVEKRVEDIKKRVNKMSQSILTKAFCGELTADWREENPKLINGENSAEALLNQIIISRENLEVVEKSRRKSSKKKSGSHMKAKPIRSVVEALEAANEELSAQQLFALSGYPDNAESDLLERFFLDIRQSLDDALILRERKGDEDYFKPIEG
jgi:type I restriction enzyme S subunit